MPYWDITEPVAPTTATFTVSLAEPLVPSQDRVKLLLVAMGDIVCGPDVALLPDQSPEAVQLIASVVLQFNVVEPLAGTFVGLADKFTAGTPTGGSTVTVTESFAFPPVPVHDKLKVLLVVMGFMVSDPETPLLPDQLPEAVQPVASVLLQFKVVEPL